MTTHDDFSDHEFQAAFESAPEVDAPSTAHTERLYRELLSRTKPVDAGHRLPASKPEQIKAWRNRAGWLAVASAVLIGAIIFAIFKPDPNGAVTSFRRVLFETGRYPWVHGQTRVEFESNVHEFETWFSPVERLAAFRSRDLIQHTDFSSGRQLAYNLISQDLNQGLANPHSEDFGRALILAILHEGDLQGAMPFHRISDLKKHELLEHGSRMLKYQFKVAWRSNVEVGWETTVWVELDSQLIRRWEERHSNGTYVVTRFDYPLEGPSDLHALAFMLGIQLDATDDTEPRNLPNTNSGTSLQNRTNREPEMTTGDWNP